MAKKDIALKHASVFAVTGSFNPTDFRFHQAKAAQVDQLFAEHAGIEFFRKLPAVLLRPNQSFVGTNAVYKPDDELQVAIDANKGSPVSPNPGSRDIASLDDVHDTLVVVGGVTFVANYSKPASSDNARYADYLANFTQAYLNEGRLLGLMRAYLSNFVNGRALWRNQYGFARRTAIAFRSASVRELFHLETPEGDDFDRLVRLASDEAAKAKGHFRLDIAMCVELGPDAEVFPSQPFLSSNEEKTRERGVPKDNNYGRMLTTRKAASGADQVVLTSNKIGNALRTVDQWYGEDAPSIAVELYGAVTSLREMRRDSKNSFFDIINEEPAYTDLTDGAKDYLMAVFIKGGLLAACIERETGEKKSKKKKTSAAEE